MSKSPTTTLLRKVEDGHNFLSDTNYVWFPFVFLKPKPDEKIDQTRILKMAPLFGLYFNIFNLARRALVGGEVRFSDFFIEDIYWTIGFYVWFNLVTAFFWNRRALRLQKKLTPAGQP